MSAQRRADHAAPFRDVRDETSAERIDRVVGIGRAPLMDWWTRFRHYTHPATYGDSGCEFAAAVAYTLATLPDLGAVVADHSEYRQDVYQAAKLLEGVDD